MIKVHLSLQKIAVVVQYLLVDIAVFKWMWNCSGWFQNIVQNTGLLKPVKTHVSRDLEHDT